MTDATQRLIEAIGNAGRQVKTTGQESWIAQCPAHEDGRPSLSIRKGRGRALLYCFAGCQTEDIAAAVGLKMDDLFDDPKGIKYTYRANGQEVRRVYRTPDKKFRQEIRPDSPVTLYVPEGVDLQTAIDTGRDIYIPEGEQDADTLASLGLVAVSAPMGAANWEKADYSPLGGTADLYVLADRDVPGMDRAQGLAKMLRGQTTGVVSILAPKIGKDVTDHIVAGETMGSLVQVPIEPDEPAPPDEFEEAVAFETFRERVRRSARRAAIAAESEIVGDRLAPHLLGDLLAREVTHDWLVPGLLERQDRFMLTGYEGHGKSYFLRQMVVCMGAGVHPFNLNKQIEPRRGLVVDAENTENQWTRETARMTGLAEAFGNSSARANVMVAAGVRIDLSRADDLNQIHRLIDRHRPDVLYLGPLYKFVAGAINNDDDAAPLITALDGFRERGITLLIEAHAGHAVYNGVRDLRPRGSSALLGWPEFGIGLQPIDPDAEDPQQYRLARWRRDREGHRNFPWQVRRGGDGELPWVPDDRKGLNG
jgi:hypothetical protein